MENIKNVVLGAVVLGLLVVGYKLWTLPEPVIPTTTRPTPVEEVQKLGAGGPIFSTDYLVVGDALSYFRSMDFATGTTTACAMQAPNASTSATITLSQDWTDGKATATALLWTLAKSATQFATTTKILTMVQAASTTLAVSTTSIPVGPDEYITLGADARAGTNMPLASTVKGRCSVQFRR